jgi:Carboxypeptidase regulatory-like domain
VTFCCFIFYLFAFCYFAMLRIISILDLRSHMTETRRTLLLLVVFILSLGVESLNVFAQGTDLGSIRGTVTDPDGATIPNAQVQITDQGTLKVYSYKTNDSGFYEAAALPAGRYNATIVAPGFNTNVIEGIVLNGSDTVSANASLHVSTSTSVQVTSEGGSINTENSTLSETLASKAALDLPRDSRDIYQFLYINPNITQGAEPGDFKFIAAQSYGASFSVDGQRSSGGLDGTQSQSQPSLESVGELNVLSNSFSAEYAGVANIRVNTKRGGAEFHGSLFYNNNNSALGAWTIADKQNQANFSPTPFLATYPKSYYNITDAGGSFGGRIPKLRNTWFFLAYEHNWSLSPIAESNETGVLHPSLLTGNFAMMNDVNKPSVPASVTLTPSEIENDTVGGLGQKFITVPQRLINPITQKMMQMVSPVIGSTAPINPQTGLIPNYSTSVKGTNSQNMGDLRIDHDFNDANRVYGVYHGSSQESATGPTSAPYTGIGLLHNTRKNSTLSLSYTHIFSTRFVNEARGGYNIQNYLTHADHTVRDFLENAGMSSADITAYGSVIGPQQLLLDGNPNISFGSSGISPIASGGANADRDLTQRMITFGDTLTWAVGRHTVKMGGDFVRNEVVDGSVEMRGAPFGTLAYSGSGMDPYVNFLIGSAPTTAKYVAAPRPAMDLSNWENGVFVQDDFRVTSRLTLNMGMRYDIYTPYVDKNDILVNFDPNFRDTNTGQVGRFIIPSAKTIPYLTTGIVAMPPNGIGYSLAADSGLGVGRGLLKADKQDFGPRVGAAFQLTSKSVLRGGIGIYYPVSSAHITRDPMAKNSFNQTATKHSTAVPIDGWPTPGDTTGTTPVSGGTVGGFGNSVTAEYVPVNVKNPRLYEWNATYEQQIPWQTTLRASYVGGHQVGQIIGNDLDEIAPNDIPFATTANTDGGLTNYADGVTPCDPVNLQNCQDSLADNARITFPAIGDYVVGFGNHGHSFTSSFQVQAERQARQLFFSFAYTYLDQKSSAVDAGYSSLGGGNYNPFAPNADYVQDSYVSRNRVVAYALYDLPFGRGKHFASSSSKLVDSIIGGWQASTNMFAKSGTGFTPFWTCSDCDPIMPGNVASGSVDAVGDFNATPSLRPLLLASPTKGRAAGYQFNPAAFGLPDIGSTMFSNPLVAKRNALMGPGTYGVNLGLHKSVRITERIGLQLGADFDNVLNHAMLSPDQNAGGGGGYFANLGSFAVQVNPKPNPIAGRQPALLPIDTNPSDGLLIPNTNFGKLNNSFSQEGISGNRQIRLRARLAF